MNTGPGSGPPLQAYSTGGAGAIMSFHRAGVYAVNMGLDSDNVLRIGGWSAGANRWQLDMSGNGSFAGSVTTNASDVRLKHNIQLIDSPLAKLKMLRGVYYDWNDDVEEKGFSPIDKHDIGVIAQELQQVIPEAVKPAPFDTGENGESLSGNKYLTVQMEKIIPLLIESIKEQQNTIETLQTEVNMLKEKYGTN